ncbi:amino acid ABC transporter ATP-binding protein [Pseudomonas seleniipraecipitans]|uniref:Amino acid ABC transporter ATP-binding protein n=1 Tax=Phytopseudomonas seleniipraecipitans TaxID=640205 RepID=A0A1G7Q0F1_9GAMM|nr:amino acid ABC transporter ATP-binding protein [Pseudomonas seleniipraecipitans]NQD79553.1 amino acid ABC transporter ATP-binding protein [Pseudomonas sp. CrR14]UUD65831.1 amino acid ABC transporter ATP-binding protein [Pseudomonas seleniipraecipitans]SDF92057.1 amino acid ABC transporter ATP-binding protein, PAAT family [Pseudomonas seleniipraecipitans]
MADIPAVRIQNLSKSFSDIEVLRDIELTVNKGEVVSVLGSSGSGKSTMLRCINWLEEPDRGSIHIAGQRIGINEEAGRKMTNRELAAIRAKTGMVFQGFNLWPHLSVLQNVMEAPVQVKGMPKEQARAIAIELLEKVGMGEKQDSYPYTLSGGQKQRVAIARVLAMSPEVILFDEPTSALDPERVGEVLTVMKNLSAEGYTMIVVTHEMEFARAVSDQVVFLEKGKIIEKSAPEKFFSNPETERVRKFLELSA